MSELLTHLYSEILSAIGKASTEDKREIYSICKGSKILYQAYKHELERRERLGMYTEDGLMNRYCLNSFIDHFEEDFENVDISILEMSDKIIACLNASGIKTLEEAAEVIRIGGNRDKNKVTVKGIGEGRKHAIHRALHKYIMDHFDLDLVRKETAEYYLNDDGCLRVRLNLDPNYIKHLGE